MNVFHKFGLAKWYTKIIIVGFSLLVIPLFLVGFLVITSFVRWEKEKTDLIQNVDDYYSYIKTAETRKVKVIIDKSGNRINLPTKIYDRKGVLIGEYMTTKKEVIPNRSIPTILKKSIIAMEDADFYNHNGVNIKRIANAFFENIFGSRKIGGSTITQQLAKHLFTDSKRTIRRKIFEFFGAKELERRFSKRDILLMYLNTVYFGHGAYGVEAASRLYFKKPAKMLNIYESALLAGILSRPEVYSPINNLNLAKLKQLQVLTRMVKLGYVKKNILNNNFEKFWQEQEKKLDTPNVSFWKMKVNKAPYFIEFIRQKLQKYFKDEEIIGGGLQIYTTLDVSMQKNARIAVNKGLKSVEAERDKDLQKWIKKETKELLKKINRVKKKKPYNPQLEAKYRFEWEKKKAEHIKKVMKPIESALVSMDSSNGYVLAMIGGRNFTFSNQLNRAIYAKRQFGSSMKPFVYATAIEAKIISAATLIDDKRRKYDDHGEVWSPKNYDNERHGVVSIREALRKSINTVAVETIFRLGPKKVTEKLGKIFFGKKGFPPVLSLPLGSVDISPLDGARIYCTIASGGRRVKPLFIRKILREKKSSDGRNYLKTIYDFETSSVSLTPPKNNDYTNSLPDTLSFDNDSALIASDPDQVLDPKAAFIVTDMMRDVLAPGGTGYYASCVNHFYLNAAGKSGTSDNNRDAWFSGFIKNIVAVVWVGYDSDKTELPKIMTGGVSAGPIWTDFMKRSFWAQQNYSFPQPAGIVEQKLCKVSSLLVDTYCTNIYTEYFMPGTVPTSYCTNCVAPVVVVTMSSNISVGLSGDSNKGVGTNK